MAAVRLASLLPAAVAFAIFIAIRYCAAAARSCRASYQRQPCQPTAAPDDQQYGRHDQPAVALQQLLGAFGA